LQQIGVELGTNRLDSLGFKKGAYVRMGVVIQMWECPLCN